MRPAVVATGLVGASVGLAARRAGVSADAAALREAQGCSAVVAPAFEE